MNEAPQRIWIVIPRPQLEDAWYWRFDPSPRSKDSIPYVPASTIEAVEERCRALEAERDNYKRLANELKIIVDVGTNDDPGTALNKLHKIQEQAVTTFRRRAIEAVQALTEWEYDSAAGGEFNRFTKNAVIKVIQSLPATEDQPRTASGETGEQQPMKVRISYTVDVDERFRRALRSYSGKTGLATREEVRRWYEDNAASVDGDLMQEYDDKMEAEAGEQHQ